MAKRKIVWTHKANIRLFEILDFYNERNGGNSYSVKLYKRFTKELRRLISQPEIGINTDFEEIRGLIVDDYILFYQITENQVVVHSVWDCRQNPDDLRII